MLGWRATSCRDAPQTQNLPTATARFGSSLDATNIKEGDDVYFECSVHANPPVLHVTWRHNSHKKRTN
ncbi:hypothetical protein E2C01_021110 [Portunus trituberculatus]|uniref:Ig-like domain-containing protein n=1 Tax=Portunus trituberculatus TaxID=210409 RepID=A0A5B7E1S7_PORTR|nr:hypothetical protein [Portunus trituberculatus]